MVFQSFNLITKYTALENVILSMDVAGYKAENKKQRALELLSSVGLDRDEACRRVLKLSGGQQQRVAIARALSYDPDIILADEPTGNLDTETQNDIMIIFRDFANQGKCVILVSLSPEVAAMCDERYELVKIGRTKKIMLFLRVTQLRLSFFLKKISIFLQSFMLKCTIWRCACENFTD